MQDVSKPIWINEKTKVENPIRIFVATPVHSEVSVHYVQALLSFQKDMMRAGIEVSFSLLKSSLVTQGRNLCVANFLNESLEYSHLLFIDSDIDFNTKTIARMLKADKDVIACPYPLKTIDWDKIWKLVQEGKIKDADQLSKSGYTFPLKLEDKEKIIVEKGIIEVTHVPTGCTLIKKQVFTKMIKEYPELEIVQPTVINGKYENKSNMYNFFDTLHDPKNKHYYGEDFGFCIKWAKVGGKCHILADESITHVGEYQFSGRFWDQLENLKKIDLTKKTSNI
tara:strand:- start:19 stop:861 length:843 start_codon:yes stop_codon:yes gene_type:complete